MYRIPRRRHVKKKLAEKLDLKFGGDRFRGGGMSIMRGRGGQQD